MVKYYLRGERNGKCADRLHYPGNNNRLTRSLPSREIKERNFTCLPPFVIIVKPFFVVILFLCETEGAKLIPCGSFVSQ